MVVRYLGSRPAWHSTFDRKRGCDARDRALPSNAIVQSVAQGCHVELRDRHHRHGREFFQCPNYNTWRMNCQSRLARWLPEHVLAAVFGQTRPNARPVMTGEGQLTHTRLRGPSNAGMMSAGLWNKGRLGRGIT